MSQKISNIIGDNFDVVKNKRATLQQTIKNVFGTRENASANRSANPYLTSNGNLLFNSLDYQRLLDSPRISQKTKEYITQATGLTPSVKKYSTSMPPAAITSSGSTKTATSGGKVQTSTIQTSTTQTVTPQKATATGNSIADAAQKYLGTPYVWGGESMAEGGMDCSGFVYNALKDAGYDVGRTTAQGYRNQGQSVSKDSLQAGDLVFYGSGGEATHIGIYLGDGKVIHSSGGSKNTASNPGKGVSITTLDSRSDYLGAKRYN